MRRFGKLLSAAHAKPATGGMQLFGRWSIPISQHPGGSEPQKVPSGHAMLLAPGHTHAFARQNVPPPVAGQAICVEHPHCPGARGAVPQAPAPHDAPADPQLAGSVAKLVQRPVTQSGFAPAGSHAPALPAQVHWAVSTSHEFATR